MQQSLDAAGVTVLQQIESVAGVAIPPGESRICGGYFDVFFASWWAEFTSLASLQLRLTVSGAARVVVTEHQPGRATRQVAQQTFETAVDNGDSVVVLTTPIGLATSAGRLVATVHAHDELGATVESAEWISTDAVARPVRLNAVVCTFNRPEYVEPLAAELSRRAAADPQVAGVTVVNQGGPIAVDPRVTLIEQDNLGGCGGFTRGIYEACRRDDVTHVLLLDDDIGLHGDSLHRAAAFMAYADDNVVLGGHMFNLDQPDELYEAGAIIDAATLIPEPLHHQRELHDPVTLDGFEQPRRVDYNGWWFFAAACDTFAEYGLPLPCFIRGDDIEYGVRLREAGMCTVAMPGIGVWHEPFYLKLGGWHLFFETRNRLMLAALHDVGDWQALKVNIRNVFVREMAMSRYHSARYLIDAMAAYSEGPLVSVDTSDSALREARAIYEQLGPTTVAELQGPRPPVESLAPAPPKPLVRGLAERALLGAGTLLRQLGIRRTGPSGSLEPGLVTPRRVILASSYQVDDPSTGSRLQYTRNVGLERRLWREFIAAYRVLAPDPALRETFESTDRWWTYWTDVFDGTR